MMHGKDLFPANGRYPAARVHIQQRPPEVSERANIEIGTEAERRRHQAPFTIARRHGRISPAIMTSLTEGNDKHYILFVGLSIKLSTSTILNTN